MKYRIVEINDHGKIGYKIQNKFLGLFWVNTETYDMGHFTVIETYDTLKKAKKSLSYIKKGFTEKVIFKDI